MELVKLPKELLLMVADNLTLPSIERLALTFNKNVTPLLLPRLKPLFAQRKWVKEVEARFDCTFATNNEVPVDYLANNHELLGVPATAQFSDPSALERMARLDYLNLNEGLHWLQPLDKSTADAMEGYGGHTVLSKRELARLEKDAAKVNVKLPPSFIKFTSSLELINRVPSTTANYFRVSGGLRKVRTAVDGGAGGYNISMWSDQQGCGYWDLYLEPGEEGRHCVLAVPWDSGYSPEVSENGDEDEEEKREEDKDKEDSQAEEEDKVPDLPTSGLKKGENSVCGATFEQWLAMTYFEQWFWFVLEYNDEKSEKLPEALKEYARQMYVKDSC